MHTVVADNVEAYSEKLSMLTIFLHAVSILNENFTHCCHAYCILHIIPQRYRKKLIIIPIKATTVAVYDP